MDASDDDIETFQSKYYKTEDIKALSYNPKEKLSILHQNISSLPLHVNELESLLSKFNQRFDCLGITESRIRKNKLPINNIELKGYNIEQTETESKCGGTLLYIKEGINYQIRPDLQIYKSKELESVFIEILNENSKNIIIGCIYKHPNMEVSDFNEFHLEKILKITSKENKKVVLMGDFNIDILKYDIDTNASNFLDIMYSNSLLPYITGPSRNKPASSSLIDNIFYNGIDEDIMAGNILTSISDHLSQFILIPNNSKIPKPAQSKIYRRDFKNMNKEAFLVELKR